MCFITDNLIKNRFCFLFIFNVKIYFHYRFFMITLKKSEATLSVFSIPGIIVRKYASNLDEQKSANPSHPPLSLFWQSIFFSAPLQK